MAASHPKTGRTANPQNFPTRPKSAQCWWMKHFAPGSDAPLALSDQSADMRATRHDGWTRERQVIFLRELAASHSVSRAARAAGMGRTSAYALRARLKGEAFDLAWHAALQCRFDALAEAALDRALNGVEVPHFHKGELIHTSRRFDERLTIALLAMRERLGPPPVLPTHPASAYSPHDFGSLLERVARGPDTWDEERIAEYVRLQEEYETAKEEEEGDFDEDEAGDGIWAQR